VTLVDPYFDPAVGDLRNLLGARSPAELRLLEAQAVFANELGLADAGIGRTNDLGELCRIHAHLFRGVYDWAGQVRVVDIKKNAPGARFFVPVSLIDRASGFVFGELGADNNLKGLSHPRSAERLAYYYD
jgi:cell filamentation protein